MKRYMETVGAGIGMILLWMSFGIVGIIGIVTWADAMLLHFQNGEWLAGILYIIFSEILIPIMGIFKVVSLIF